MGIENLFKMGCDMFSPMDDGILCKNYYRQTKDELLIQAKKDGWIMIEGKWICPAHKQVMKKSIAEIYGITPGEWKDSGKTAFGLNFPIISTPDPKYPPAELYLSFVPNHKEFENNIQLICQAPKMLELLHEIYEYEIQDCKILMGPAWEARHNRIEKILKAIKGN